MTVTLASREADRKLREKDNDALLRAALANYEEDINLPADSRSLKPKAFRALHDALVRAGQIDPEPEFDKA